MMYTINTEDELTEFAELCRQYPNEVAEDLLIKAGGRDDAYRYVGCTWCGERFPYEVADPADEKRANDEANAHALTCEKDPNVVELKALRAENAKLKLIYGDMQAMTGEEFLKKMKQIMAQNETNARMLEALQLIADPKNWTRVNGEIVWNDFEGNEFMTEHAMNIARDAIKKATS